MDHRSLWAPWRLPYLKDYEEAKRMSEEADSGVTFLSAYWDDPAGDRDNHVVLRTEQGLILLNRKDSNPFLHLPVLENINEGHLPNRC